MRVPSEMKGEMKGFEGFPLTFEGIAFAFDRLSILLIFLKFDSGQCR